MRRPARGAVGRADESGAVTAELALGIPLLLALTVGLVWMLSLGAAQVRVIDASREAARAVARGDDVAAAEAVASRIAPAGATVRIGTADGQVTVTTSVHVPAPGGLLGSWRGMTVSDDAVAQLEEASE